VRYDSTTPAPSLRLKRTGLAGAPVRKSKLTPESAGDQENYYHDLSLSQQENIPLSIERHNTADIGSSLKIECEAISKLEGHNRNSVHREPVKEAVPFSVLSINTPMKQAPLPPPPKMSILKTATAADGMTNAKQKRRRAQYSINGKYILRLEASSVEEGAPMFIASWQRIRNYLP
jgi:serine/threonine-protein kinase TTK/MPS1